MLIVLKSNEKQKNIFSDLAFMKGWRSCGSGKNHDHSDSNT